MYYCPQFETISTMDGMVRESQSHTRGLMQFYMNSANPVMNLCLTGIVLCLVGIICCASVLFLIGTFRLARANSDDQNVSVKTLIVAGSGGHTTEVLRLLEGLSIRYYPRTYVVAETDVTSENKIKEFEESQFRRHGVRHSFDIIKIPRSREVGQSWITSGFSFVRGVLRAVPLVLNAEPELLLCNGPGTCIPICLITRLSNIFKLVNSKIIFVESICRINSLSLSGKIVYYLRLADKVVVQWPELKLLYPMTDFLDRIV